LAQRAWLLGATPTFAGLMRTAAFRKSELKPDRLKTAPLRSSQSSLGRDCSKRKADALAVKDDPCPQTRHGVVPNHSRWPVIVYRRAIQFPPEHDRPRSWMRCSLPMIGSGLEPVSSLPAQTRRLTCRRRVSAVARSGPLAVRIAPPRPPQGGDEAADRSAARPRAGYVSENKPRTLT
jgi:hypothetical protein